MTVLSSRLVSLLITFGRRIVLIEIGKNGLHVFREKVYEERLDIPTVFNMLDVET